MTLARAVEDPNLSEEILSTARQSSEARQKARSGREDVAATMPALLHSIKPPRLHQINGRVPGFAEASMAEVSEPSLLLTLRWRGLDSNF